MSHSSQNLEIQQNYDEEAKIPNNEIDDNNTKKSKKAKDIENESRCQSAQSVMRELKKKYLDTSRTRSETLLPFPQPLTLKLPLKKFYKMYSKIVTQLETVKTLSESKKNETENLADLRRQIQRADEFSIRFSRNNLYETKRVINEVKRIIVPYPYEKLTQSESKELSKKIMLGYQLASQSLQTYINHVKNPVNLELPEKLSELTILIADLFMCCEHLALPPGDFYTQNDAVKLCNDLISQLNAKAATCNFSDIKEILAKKKSKPLIDDISKIKNLSMYKKKFTCLGLKTKSDVPKKKFGVFLANRMKRLKKKDEKKARITHEIYTQKMHPGPGKRLGNPAVKYEPTKEVCDKDDMSQKKLMAKKSRFLTPKEVRSQDDDVETMVQAIGNDENPLTKLGLTPRETDEESISSNNFCKVSFRELLLELIDELQHTDKKEQKATLKKLLSSIQHCSKSQENSPKTPRMKVYHFKSRDMEDRPEMCAESDEGKPKVDLTTLYEGQKMMEEILSRERRLNSMFKPLKQRKLEKAEGEPIPRGKIKLRLSEQTMKSVYKYRKSFSEYKKKDIMYTKTQAKKPWDLVAEISDHIILDVIKEISLDLQNDVIWRRLFYNELLEVVN